MNSRSRFAQPTGTQERLHLAAVDLFTEQGYQNTSLRDLAAHLGIGAGSLYYHIESKQALLFDLIEECMSDLLGLTRARLKNVQGMRPRLRAFVGAFVEFQLGERKRLQLMLRERRNLTAEQRRLLGALHHEYTQCLAVIIGPVTIHGSLEGPRMKCFTRGVIGMLESLPDVEDIEPPQQVTEQLTAMILGAAASISSMGGAASIRAGAR
ncbi:TetR/AcrR family transcriptional regulator [Pseudomonas guariconensis]|uniref:TetR/AcrR family transcriptional regulator n=1 Tax=Pseudomonas TaxID=286 RepID=UPI0020983BE6|nr:MULTISPECIES: TetR/AcrR family transcriptional regulator [Pseudomonas]MCO7641644.1 TetR/AcrR family transcriptional regulator [Pseudomonas sp. S 311-6]MCO7516510.1 TetR/AcrR family transcriptional regulator [Pseudomonas putida]MCO7566762.1 TetR/AcrR family transcriptional regulator [Pseudomonas mosselii]MCO7606824.1 TetR/AcrR family transcriptional regulator [Pseudomonas guariconensis]MCO7617986.1 TetR/AcrR family transcriptional regulator [Pseudomonas guariconensis]